MSKGRPHERFGPFVLLRRLESDALGELWRALEWKADGWGRTVAVHILTGGDREAMRAAAEKARPVIAALSGTTVARGQQIGFADGAPWLAHEYPGGRSLQSIVTKARATGSTTPNPIPVDQALAIVEKLALSIESLDNVRYHGEAVHHGALVPQFVWVSEDGEVRTAGHQLGPGILGSLHAPEIRHDYGAYYAPELRSGNAISRKSDVWALGAILHLLLTGDPIPDAADAEAVAAAVQAPRLMHQTAPVPAAIRVIVARALEPDPSKRYPGAVEMRADLEKLLNSGEYAPTTFNLAFYIQNLLRREIETETAEREREAALDHTSFAAPSAPGMAAPAPSAAPPSHAPFAAAMAAEQKRSRAPLLLAALLALLVGGAAAAWVITRQAVPPLTTTAAMNPQPAPIAPLPTATVEPVLARGEELPEDELLPDEETRKAAREEEIRRRLQAEMLKLQTDYDRQIRQQTRQTQDAIAAARQQQTPPPARKVAAAPPSEPAPSKTPPPAQPSAAAAQKAPETTTSPPVQQPAPPAQEVASAPVLREGDLVGFNELDRTPEALSPIRPTYPPIALRRRMEGSVILSVLINESGRVEDVRVLRGDSSRLGFDEAAIRAVRQATFTPPMKDGKRVRTWKPVPVAFKP